MTQIGYKQFMEYFNKVPKNLSNLESISKIIISRFNPKLKKTTDIEKVAKRKPKYVFDVITKTPKTNQRFKHIYYFDSKERAIKEHKNLLLLLYDKSMEKYLRKMDKNRRLSQTEKEEIIETIEKFEKLTSSDL